jgi:hypothetical protein
MPEDKTPDWTRLEEHGIATEIVAPLVVAGSPALIALGNKITQPKPKPKPSSLSKGRE